MKKILSTILTIMLAISAHAQVFEVGADKEKKREVQVLSEKPHMQDLRIDIDAIKSSPNAKAFDIKEELLFEQKDKKEVVKNKPEIAEIEIKVEEKPEIKEVRQVEVPKEPIKNVQINNQGKVEPKVEVAEIAKLITKEQMCYRETDAIVNLLGLVGNRQELVKTYLNSLCLKEVDVENYQKIYADAKNEENVLDLIKNYKIQSFATIEQKLIHIKLLTLNSNIRENELYKTYNDLLSLYENFIIQENMANFILSEEIKSMKDKKLAKELSEKIDKELKTKQHGLSVRIIYYLNYIFSNGMYEKAREFDRFFIPKILDKSSKNSFIGAKLAVEQCDYLHYAIPTINLNKLKVSCIIDNSVK